MEAQPQTNTSVAASTAAHELKKQFLSQVKQQIEYYLSDDNLKQDQFFFDVIKGNDTNSVPVDTFLNCNKIKKLQATKQDILEACADSEKVEPTGDAVGIKRKNGAPLPEFEPKPTKKVKTEANSAFSFGKEENKPFEAKIYKITLSKEGNVKWDKIQQEIQSALGVRPSYTRVNGTEGHIAFNNNKLTNEEREKLANGSVKFDDVELKIEECINDDLKQFHREHGKHLDMCLEKSGLKRKSKPGKVEKKDNGVVDFVFYNQKYTSLSPLKYVFKSILSRTSDDEKINEADGKLLQELLKYHDSYEEKVKDLDYFTVGQHPSYKQTRCFFVVRKDGSREDFSSTKCFENLRKKHGLGDDEEKGEK